MPTMEESGVFSQQAADVAEQAMKEGVARVTMPKAEVYAKAKAGIDESRALTQAMLEQGFIKRPPESMLDDCLDFAVSQVKK